MRLRVVVEDAEGEERLVFETMGHAMVLVSRRRTGAIRELELEDVAARKVANGSGVVSWFRRVFG